MQQEEEVLQNTYYQSKNIKSIRAFRFTEASTHRLSQNDLITEPTFSGIQTDRTHVRNIRQLIRPLKQPIIEPVSTILAEEKIKLQNKFLLLDHFTTRHSQHQVQENERKLSQPTFSISEQESLVTLYRNQFFYTKLRIKDHYSPMILQLIIKQGDPNTRLRIFASPKFIQPNRFNAVAEVSGRQLKYASNSELFTEETLYIAILAVHELQVAIRVEFGRPATKRVQRERKEKSVHEFPPDLEMQVEEIMLRRRLRYANQQNYVELNKNSQMSRRMPQTSQTKRVEVRQKLISMKTEQNLKRMAQMQVHDIAKQIHRRQLEMQRDIRQREYVQKSWFRVIWLVNVLAPKICDIIDNQRRLVAKNMKKQIFLIQLLRKMQKRVQKFGPSCKLRTILHGKYTLNAIALNSKEVAKQRAKKIVTQILQSNIVCFTTESKGTHVVNLIKKCVNRLVKHKISRIEFMSNLKLFLSVQYKQLYQIALRYSKISESKNKRDPIHFLLYDAYLSFLISSFLHQMTKKLLHHLFETWNKNFVTFRKATKEERERQGKKGVALFWQPPKLFELPQDIVIRVFLFEELEKRGLITGEYRE